METAYISLLWSILGIGALIHYCYISTKGASKRKKMAVLMIVSIFVVLSLATPILTSYR